MFKIKEEVINWLDSMEVKNYIIEDNLTVNVDGDVDLRYKGLTELPVQFGIIKGDFICADNYLTSLKGSPRVVTSLFNCKGNQLKSLEYGPEKVKYYSCHINKLTSLKFVASQVEDLDCSLNNITSLQYLPNVKTFNCAVNKLTSLLGCPEEFEGGFDCSSNQLTSLEYGPKKVAFMYSCQHNNIKEFPYLELEVGDLFICSHTEDQRIDDFSIFYTKELLMLPSHTLELYKLKKNLNNNLPTNTVTLKKSKI